MPSGNLYLLSGHLGSNTALFAQQVLYNSVVRKEKAAYYTLENSSADIIQDMHLFDLKIQRYIEDGSWIFARAIPSSMKKTIDSLPEVTTEKRIALEDSLSPLMDNFLESVKEGRNTAIHLSHLIRSFSLEEVQNLLFYMAGISRKYGGIHFILMTEGAHEQSVSATIKDAVDSVFEFSAEYRGSELEVILTVQKIRNMMPKSRILRLAVKNSGMVTETIRRM